MFTYNNIERNSKISQGKSIRFDPSTLSDFALRDLKTLIDSLETSESGLAINTVESKHKKYGFNIVSTEKPEPLYMQFFSCVINPFNVVLLLLAAISCTTGDFDSMAIMSLMVSISVLIRFLQEYKSGKEAEKLKSMVRITTTVQRLNEDGSYEIIEIPVSQVVLGDIVQLSSGDMVPADIRLISSKDLFISQAMLTGESMPVEKNDFAGTEVSSEFDRPNLCFMGTNVLTGSAKGLVFATGDRTYLSSLAKSITNKTTTSSFDIGVNKISWVLIRFIFAMAPVVFFINGFTKGDWVEAMMFSISVAVGLTPEMLPMIVTANLAKGAIKMAKDKVIVKHLNSIHNLGAMDILCTDKTGTLTQDRIILHNHLNIEGDDDKDVLKYGYLNSVNQTGLKNLLDVAILEEAEKNYNNDEFKGDISGYKKIDELPFDFIRRRMSVIVEGKDGKHTIICKGAVEELMSICTMVENNNGLEPITEEVKNKIMKMTLDLNNDGFRVLIIAYRDLPTNCSYYSKDDEKDFVLKGLLTFLDPPKESTYKAIPMLLKLGVKIKVLTGDNHVVTRKVCSQVGIVSEPMLSGKEIEAMSDEELREKAVFTNVFAKVSPLQKSRIIKILKSTNHTVGFLGDGVNDAPALHEADVGISVDTAADIAKESADIILLEKSLMVLGAGIKEGRRTFINIIKYIKMALSSNFGNVFSVLGASIMLPFLPMLPIQLLTQNLLYDISQLAIPIDKVNDSLMRKPRDWAARDLVNFMLFIGPISSIFDYITFSFMWFYFDWNSTIHENLFHTGWFIEGLITQTMIVHIIRTEKSLFIKDPASLPLILSTLTVVLIGVCLPFTSFAGAIGMAPLPIDYFIFLAVMILGYFSVTSLVKAFYIKKFKIWL
jgi:P-type Mg2+ transporter